MKTILITGGSGFIGSHLIYQLLHFTNYHVINLDALTYASEPNRLGFINAEPKYSLRYTFKYGRIEDRNILDSISSEFNIDYVINCAAETHVDNSIDNSSPFITTNIVGTHTLLEWALYNKRMIERYVQVSTDEVYGSLGESGKFTENSPLQPNSPYSSSKGAADLLCRSYAHTYGLPIHITRCSNNYGALQHPEKLIPKTIERAIRNEHIPVYGNGLNTRDWIWAGDHAAAILKVLHYSSQHEIFNIGANEEFKNIDIVKILLAQLNKPESLISMVEDRLGHDWRYAIDSSKIQTLLKWSPSISFDKMIKRLCSEYSTIDVNMSHSHL